MSIEQLTDTDFIWEVYHSSEDSKPNCNKMAGVDGITPQQFQRTISRTIPRLQNRLRNGTYVHSKLKHYAIRNARGEQDRIICTPTQEDKLVQRMLCRYLTKDLSTNQPLDRLRIGSGVAYGMGRDFQDTAHNALSDITRVRATKPYGIKTDISNFFNEIERPSIMQILSDRIDDPEIVTLLEQVVNAEIKGAGLLLRGLFANNDMRLGRGLRQGMPLSPILASALLTDFDTVLGQPQWFNAYRMADDILCLCSTREQAERIQIIIEDALVQLSLSIPPLGDDRGKTRIFGGSETVKFLGINIYPAPRSSGYLQGMPSNTIERAAQKISNIFSRTHVDYRDMPIPDRLSQYQSILNGYRGYFSTCGNHQAFMTQMNSLKDECLSTLLQSIYGENFFSGWNEYQKRMLSLPI